ncbi:hypothetical protein GEMRC1_005781 [Eukaryota sp. GEM-RC1]
MSNPPSQTGSIRSSTNATRSYGVYTLSFVSFCQTVSQIPRRNTFAVIVLFVQCLQMLSLSLNMYISPWLSEKYFPDIRRFIHFGLPYWTESSSNLTISLIIGSALVCVLLLLVVINVYHHKESVSVLTYPFTLKVLVLLFRLVQIPYASVLLLTLGCTSEDSFFHPWTSIGGCWSVVSMSLRAFAGVMLVTVLFLSFVFDNITRVTNLTSKYVFTQNHVQFSFFTYSSSN